ncbi:Disease resistance protein (TIR-NBS-LRR class) family [Melia azedarach]|uniref:Disease resistance protein (TIR-NBS-LRR class) family n=1 Tax=Melia azedarach TaxID=155640 RepID=A0ACC1YJW6_MELAZ|nr:Disease resistance protein (TIR-NBS-LRR class) family [Melia azedarach]
MATTYLRKLNEHEVHTDFPRSVNIFLPGYRIPEWFNNQSFGSSITIRLPQLCCNRSFIGFALCDVLAFGDVYAAAEDFIVVCYYGFDEANEGGWMMMASECDIIYDPDHICIGFIPCLPDSQHHTSFSFDFSATEGVTVECCGVCPLYAHPIETKPNTLTVNMVPPTVEECRKLHNEFHDEASTSATTVERSDEEEINTPKQQSSFLSQIFRCLGLDLNCL